MTPEMDHDFTYTITTHDPQLAQLAVDAPLLLSALMDMDRELRTLSKHSENEVEAEHARLFRSLLWQIIKDNGIEGHFD